MPDTLGDVTIETDYSEEDEKDLVYARTRDADGVEYEFTYAKNGRYWLVTWVISAMAEDRHIHEIGSDELDEARSHVERTLVDEGFLNEKDAFATNRD